MYAYARPWIASITVSAAEASAEEIADANWTLGCAVPVVPFRGVRDLNRHRGSAGSSGLIWESMESTRVACRVPRMTTPYCDCSFPAGSGESGEGMR